MCLIPFQICQPSILKTSTFPRDKGKNNVDIYDYSNFGGQVKGQKQQQQSESHKKVQVLTCYGFEKKFVSACCKFQSISTASQMRLWDEDDDDDNDGECRDDDGCCSVICRKIE